MISFFRTCANIVRIVVLLAVTLVLLRAEAVTWGPVLGNVTPTSVQLSWLPGDLAVKGILFGGKLIPGPVKGNYRPVTLGGLTPDTQYHYTFGDKTFRFRTAPDGPAEFTFVVYGDSRSGHAVHKRIIDALTKMQPRFIVNTGDLVANGNNANDWRRFFTMAAPLTGGTPYLAVPGNHEGNSANLFRLFPPAGEGSTGGEWYAYTYGGVRVIMLNSTRDIVEQRDWLDQYLADHEGEARWTIAAFHYPPFSSSARGGTASMREEWVPVLQRHGVDAVFLGHDHFYERDDYEGTPYIITGGGGAPLYDPNVKNNPYQKIAEKVNHYLRVDVSPTTMRIQMIRLDGSVGDEVVLSKPMAVPAEEQ